MELSAYNFQGRDFEVDLGTRAFIHGPHGAGKTAVTNAPQVALYGFVNSLGKEGTAALINGSGQADAFFTVDGKQIQISHKLERTEKSVRTMAAIAVDADIFKDSAASEMIGSYVPEMLYCDPTGFFSLNGTARKDALLQYLVTTEGAKEQLAWVRLYALVKAWDKIKGAGAPNDMDPPTTEELDPLTTEFLTKLETRATGTNQEDAVRALHAIVEHEAGQVGEVIEALHAMKKDAAATKTNINKALEGLGKIAPAEVQRQAGTLAELEAKHGELIRQRAELHNAASREDRVTQEIANADKEVERLTALKATLTEQVGSETRKSVETKYTKAKTALDAIRANEPDAPADVDRDALWLEVVKLERKRGRVAGYGKLRGTIFSEVQAGRCPLIGEAIKCDVDTAAVCRDQEDEGAKLCTKLDEHDAELKGLMRELDMTQAAADYKEKRQAWQKSLDAADLAVFDLTALGGRIKSLETATASLKEATAKAADIRKTKSAAIDEAHVASLNGQLAELEEDLNAARNAAAFQKLLKGVGVDDIYFDAALWSGAWDGAKEGRDAWIQARIGDVSERVTANLLTTGIFPEDSYFHIDVSGKKLELGINSGGNFIDAAALSNAQRSLFMLSMLAALPRVGLECEQRILLHDVDGILPEHYGRIMEWLDRQDFDVVVLTSPHKPETAPETWKVFDVTKLEIIEDDDGTDLNEAGEGS